MPTTWDEILTVRTENRRELTLHGSDVQERIDKAGLDEELYTLTGLNTLAISGTTLKDISEKISSLKNLTSLSFANNKITILPSTIKELTALKSLDVSGNQLANLPDLSSLVNLQTLNANLNELTSFPDITNLKKLAYLYISKNKLTSLPEGICSPDLALLSTIDAAHNEITALPDDLSNLPHLIILNVSANKLDCLPFELCECAKLKELIIFDNKMKDRKLLKLAEHSSKSLLNYLKVQLEKKRVLEGASKKDKKSKSKGKGKGGKKETQDIERDIMYVSQFEPDSGLTVSTTSEVTSVRQYIICCIIRDLDFTKSNNMFKRFINLQTRLHENVCDKRNAATIATHDMKLVKFPLVYDAVLPQELKIIPLFSSKLTDGEMLMKDLRDKAEAYRKEKKRSNFGGIHKYLDLLKDKSHYPCVKDAEGDAISFPPITNSEKTKISKETQEVLIEVTSTVSLDMCKKVMEETLMAVLLTGVGTKKGSSEEAGATEQEDKDQASSGDAVDTSRMRFPQSLNLEQVKVLDPQGNLKVIYPSRIDLQNPAFDVVRNYE